MTPDQLAHFQIRRKQVLAIVLTLSAAAIIFVDSWPHGSQMHEFVEAIGIGLIVAGILGRMWCTLFIGGSKSQQLVKTGPYSIVRNPLYLFSSIAAAGVGAQSGSVIVAIVMFAGCALAFHFVIAREEKFLTGAFGAPYVDYVASVPRFFPDFSLYRAPEEVMVRPDRLYSTFGDGLVFFVAMPIFETIEWMQNTGWLVPVIHLP